MSGRKNCEHCTRWRPVSDYAPYFSHKRGKEYLRRVCEYCHRKKQRLRWRKFNKDQKRKFKERTREYAAARRRREGKPVRENLSKDRTQPRMTFPAEPLLNFVNVSGKTDKEIAEQAGLDVKSGFSKVRQRNKVELDTADRICVVLGIPLSLVYPEGEEVMP